MKKLLLSATLLAISVSAYADEKLEHCKSVVEYVEVIARAHQNGVTLDKAMSVSGTNHLHQLMIAIYTENTRFRTESLQLREIQDTKNAAMISCMKGDK